MQAGTLKEAERVVTALGDEGLVKDAVEARKIDPVAELKLSVFGFFKTQIERIARMETLRDKAQRLLERRLDEDSDHPIPLDEAMRIFNAASAEVQKASESIVSLFRPVPGAPSLLANNMGSGEEGDDRDRVWEGLTPEDRQAVELLREIIAERSTTRTVEKE